MEHFLKVLQDGLQRLLYPLRIKSTPSIELVCKFTFKCTMKAVDVLLHIEVRRHSHCSHFNLPALSQESSLTIG